MAGDLLEAFTSLLDIDFSTTDETDNAGVFEADVVGDDWKLIDASDDGRNPPALMADSPPTTTAVFEIESVLVVGAGAPNENPFPTNMAGDDVVVAVVVFVGDVFSVTLLPDSSFDSGRFASQHAHCCNC